MRALGRRSGPFPRAAQYLESTRNREFGTDFLTCESSRASFLGVGQSHERNPPNFAVLVRERLVTIYPSDSEQREIPEVVNV